MEMFNVGLQQSSIGTNKNKSMKSKLFWCQFDYNTIIFHEQCLLDKLRLVQAVCLYVLVEVPVLCLTHARSVCRPGMCFQS